MYIYISIESQWMLAFIQTQNIEKFSKTYEEGISSVCILDLAAKLTS